MYVFGQTYKGIVNVSEDSRYYYVKHEPDAWQPGHYETHQWSKDDKTIETIINTAMTELDFQNRGLEFPTQQSG